MRQKRALICIYLFQEKVQRRPVHFACHSMLREMHAAMPGTRIHAMHLGPVQEPSGHMIEHLHLFCNQEGMVWTTCSKLDTLHPGSSAEPDSIA